MYFLLFCSVLGSVLSDFPTLSQLALMSIYTKGLHVSSFSRWVILNIVVITYRLNFIKVVKPKRRKYRIIEFYGNKENAGLIHHFTDKTRDLFTKAKWLQFRFSESYTCILFGPILIRNGNLYSEIKNQQTKTPYKTVGSFAWQGA